MKTYEYDEAVDYGKYSFSTMAKKATYLFRNASDAVPACRLGIDFLYHFCKDVGEFEMQSHKGELIFTEVGPSVTKWLGSDLD